MMDTLQDAKRRPGEDVGDVSVQSDQIMYESTTYTTFSLRISSIAVIGEFTNENGPLLEDQFWVLVESPSIWHMIPINARGQGEAMKLLGTRLQTSLEFRSFGAELDSIVDWPALLRDQRLFDFVPIRRSLLDRILRFWALDTAENKLTAGVSQFLIEREREGGRRPSGRK